jgi:hypothetical protein
LCNKYGNESQTCRPKGKTYRDALLRELVHSVTVEHALEYKVVCGSEPAGRSMKKIKLMLSGSHLEPILGTLNAEVVL